MTLRGVNGWAPLRGWVNFLTMALSVPARGLNRGRAPPDREASATPRAGRAMSTAAEEVTHAADEKVTPGRRRRASG